MCFCYRRRMSPRAILWSYLVFAVAFPAVCAVGGNLDFAAYRLAFAVLAVLAAAGAVGWAATYTAAARRSGPAHGVAVWIATACLAVGFGSVADSSWQEYQAGMSLPIINLFLYLIPLGLLILLGSAVAQTAAARTSRARGERQR